MNNDLTAVDLSGAFQYKGKIYFPKITSLFESYVPLVLPEKTPDLLYKGPRIPLDLWRQVVSFMIYSNATYKSEAQGRFLLNTTLEQWVFVVMPQNARGGMTSKEIPDHPKKKEILQKYDAKDGWFPSGTVHHHCNTTAFQSGTDFDDEKNQNGIHITLGRLNDTKRIDIHARVSYGGVMYPVIWSQWFDIDDMLVKFDTGKNPQYTRHLYDFFLEFPYDDDFPVEWKENLIDTPATHNSTKHFIPGASLPGASTPANPTGGLPWTASSTPVAPSLATTKTEKEKSPEKETGSDKFPDYVKGITKTQLEAVTEEVTALFREVDIFASDFEDDFLGAQGDVDKMVAAHRSTFHRLKNLLAKYDIEIKDYIKLAVA